MIHAVKRFHTVTSRRTFNSYKMVALTCGRGIAWILLYCSCFRCVYGAVFEPTVPSTNVNFNLTQDTDLKVNDNHSSEDLNTTNIDNRVLNDVIPKLSENERILGNVIKPGMPQNSTTMDYKLPEEWSKFCHLGVNEYYESEFTPKTELIAIICHVTPEYSGMWSMADLREQLEQFKGSNLSFSVDINCEHYSQVSLSWPIKVHNLFKIRVTHCTIMDFLAEFNLTDGSTLPADSLRVMDLKHNDMLLSVDNFVGFGLNIDKLPKDMDCGHEETVESLSFRDISFDFFEDMELVNKKLVEFGEKMIRLTARISHKCIYKRLMTIDNSQSTSRSIYHMDLLTNNHIFSELRTINMSYNHLQVLNDEHLHWSARFPKLELFDLSNNDISKLYRFEVPLSDDPNTTINLQYNNISMIDVEDFDMFSRMPTVFIDLRNNGINCNCSDKMEKLLQYISAGKHFEISNVSDYSYIGDLLCTNPEHLYGKKLKSISFETVCEPIVHKEYFLVPILCLSASVVLLVILLFIALRYRQEITILLFTRLNIIIPCQTRENYDNNKEYDAFVSYSSNEDEEVESIFENLENRVDGMSRPEFKFCMHHRDFVAGKTIFDNVTRAVENSRHTIILLSNHFLKSEYCLYEFQEAFRQSIMEKRRHLVIVMMEDIPEERLPRDLRRCVKTFTYIKRDDYLFTERLVYALSVKQKGKVVKSLKQPDLTSKTTPTKKSSNNTNLSDKKLTTPNRKDSKSDTKHKLSSKLDNTINPCSDVNDVAIEMSDIVGELERTLDNGDYEPPRLYRKLSEKATNGKLDLNIRQISDINLSPVERKILQKITEYDRSMSQISQDTGYSSDIASLAGRPSPEIDGHFEDISLHEESVNC